MSKVGDEIEAANGRWSFGGDVPKSFEGHIERSVPYYREGHALVAALSDYFLYDGARSVEIGCSTAALTRLVAERNAGRQVQYTGIEIEPAMVTAAQDNVAHLPGIDVIAEDACHYDYSATDFVTAYYTIQFVRPALRQALFDRIYAGLNWGGALIFFEKVRAPDARFQDMMTALYTDFKLDRGFEETEIIHKARSIKGILEPFSSQANIDMAHRAGFADCMTVFKHICFEGFLAIK